MNARTVLTKSARGFTLIPALAIHLARDVISVQGPQGGVYQEPVLLASHQPILALIPQAGRRAGTHTMVHGLQVLARV